MFNEAKCSWLRPKPMPKFWKQLNTVFWLFECYCQGPRIEHFGCHLVLITFCLCSPEAQRRECHLCRVAGNTVIPYGTWVPVAVRRLANCYTPLYLYNAELFLLTCCVLTCRSKDKTVFVRHTGSSVWIYVTCSLQLVHSWHHAYVATLPCETLMPENKLLTVM